MSDFLDDLINYIRKSEKDTVTIPIRRYQKIILNDLIQRLEKYGFSVILTEPKTSNEEIANTLYVMTVYK